MPTPRVFVSYSWDSDEHRSWVREFAVRLRADGIEAVLDQWEVALGDQLPAFMERSVRESDFVLIICTPKYKERSNSRRGGVGYEGDVMTAEVFSLALRRKFIPVLRYSSWAASAPSWLVGSVYVDLSGHPYSEERYRELLDTLHGRREKAPPVTLPVPSGSGTTHPYHSHDRGALRRRKIEGISEQAQRILDNIERQPAAWEARLFGQVLADELIAASSLKRELTMGVSLGPFRHLDDGAEFTWIRQHMDDLSAVFTGLVQLVNHSLQQAMGADGVPGEPEGLIHIAQSIAAAYRQAITWTIEWRKIRFSERHHTLASTKRPRAVRSIYPRLPARSMIPA